MPLWRVRGCVRVLLNDPTSELAREIAGDNALLSPPEALHLIYDALEGANWQRSGSKTGKPSPLRQQLAEQRRAARRDSQDNTAAMSYLAQFHPAYQASTDVEEDQPE